MGIYFCCSGQSLERERKEFRVATVVPLYQLKDDLCFRLGKMEDQQPIERMSNWEQVKQQVCLRCDMKIQLDVCSLVTATFKKAGFTRSVFITDWQNFLRD